MTYSRQDFLGIAVAGLPVVIGVPWLFIGAAQAKPSNEGQYTQARADLIHIRSTEAAIRRTGKDPEEVKAQVDRRLRQLRAGSVN